jgi:hypothetical protein
VAKQAGKAEEKLVEKLDANNVFKAPMEGERKN